MGPTQYTKPHSRAPVKVPGRPGGNFSNAVYRIQPKEVTTNLSPLCLVVLDDLRVVNFAVVFAGVEVLLVVQGVLDHEVVEAKFQVLDNEEMSSVCMTFGTLARSSSAVQRPGKKTKKRTE